MLRAPTQAVTRTSINVLAGNHSPFCFTEYSIESFLDWYYCPSPSSTLRRTAIDQRIEFLSHSLSPGTHRNQEKRLQKQNKRESILKDRHLRFQSTINKALVDFQAKTNIKMRELATEYQEIIDRIRRSRYERFRLGEEGVKRLKEATTRCV